MRCARWSCGGTEVSVLESAVAFREERSRVAPPPRADSVAGSVASSVAEITGLDPAQAASYLELAGGNLEVAVQLFFDGVDAPPSAWPPPPPPPARPGYVFKRGDSGVGYYPDPPASATGSTAGAGRCVGGGGGGAPPQPEIRRSPPPFADATADATANETPYLRAQLRQLTAERDQLRDAVKTLSADVLCAERASCDGYAPRSRAASTAAASSAPTRDPFLELLGWQWD